MCIGPPIEQGGFYYDVALDNNQMVTDADYVQLQALVNNIVKDNQQFERMVITKAEALELFKDNKYKVQLIEQKIQVCFINASSPDVGRTLDKNIKIIIHHMQPEETTTAYRCGPLIDLCRGPHVPSTKRIEEMKVLRHSGKFFQRKRKEVMFVWQYEI